VIEKALQISESTTPIFRSAIIDEAQDLSLMSLRFIRNLVNGANGEDREDDLLLVGDGAQRVYASCFTLAQAGLQVRGRSTILEVNYRNTHEIIEAALAVAGNREVDDLGTKVQVPTHTTSVLPSGSKPTLVVTNSIDQRNAYVAKRIRELYESKGYLPSDIGVLAPTNYLVNRFTKGLTRAGIPAVSMAYDRDHSADKLRVGTFYRAKGLEFKAVFLLGLENFPSRAKRGETEATYEDRHDLELNVIFVAMTRAREHLELVTLGAPSESVEKARDFLEPTSP
jgi:superfamily I DNA/RNA helicase